MRTGRVPFVALARERTNSRRRRDIPTYATEPEERPAPALEGLRPFTAKQGQYLAFIYYYSKIHGMPPAEADFRRFFRVTPPVVHQMIKTLHAHGFIDREPGKARSIRLRLTRADLPDLD